MKNKHLRRRNPLRSMIWRRMVVILLILTQLFAMFYYLYSQSQASQILNQALTLVSVLVAFYIVSRPDKTAYKILWIVLILVSPIFGGIFYILSSQQMISRRFRRAIQDIDGALRPLFRQQEGVLEEAMQTYPEFQPHMRYLAEYMGFPLCGRTRTTYLNSGEAFYEKVLQEIDKAERYVFLEFFIMNEGVMLNTILDKLEEKLAQGVEVRIMYDDIGCFLTLPVHYSRQLRARGFQCTVFNPFSPIVSTMQNNRDHRKIIVIDGKVAFTGGINLADEYINEYPKYGHWRDCAIMLEGEAAWSMTLIFLQLWRIHNRKGWEKDAELNPWKDSPCTIEEGGYVQPYADSPVDDENVGEHVYIQILNNARRYIYINTPYLIIDDNLLSAMKLAAKSGVDVRIVTPHIYDKRLVHFTTRSYYRELIAAGIRIYEYTDGFNHAKTFVCDDKIATVGTTNLDYRSLYLHFECGVVVYDTDSVLESREDFLRTLPICHEITLEECKAPALVRMFQEILRIFAPLM